MKKRQNSNSKVDPKDEIRKKYEKIDADLKDEYDKAFPTEPQSVEDIEFELYLNDLKRRKKDKDVKIVTVSETNSTKAERQIEEIHKLNFSNPKELDQNDLVAKMMVSILNKTEKKQN